MADRFGSPYPRRTCDVETNSQLCVLPPGRCSTAQVPVPVPNPGPGLRGDRSLNDLFEGAALMHTPNRVTLASLSWWFAAAAAFLLVAAVVLGY